MTSTLGVTELVLRRDRAVIVTGLVVITALSWWYMFYLAAGMNGAMPASEMGAIAAPRMEPWKAVDFVLTWVMWSVMMVAMMVPSAAPMILVFARVKRNRRNDGSASLPTAAFVAGYLLAWTAFSAAATLAQWGLHSAALLSPMMVSTNTLLGGLILIGAGLFQWTPLKRACLVHCRSPLHFLMSGWRDGAAGALTMGAHHGLYCVGCCWILMALLFVAGVMNLLWVAAIASFVLIEKLTRHGELVGRVAGVALVLAGVAVILAGP